MYACNFFSTVLNHLFCLSQFSNTTLGTCINRKNKPNQETKREDLPVWLAREHFLKHVKESSTLILVGETGSGKTTLAPQLILDAGLAGSRGRIACTQPRRVAAISVARHVAQERNCELGAEVGYTVRFDDCTSKQTRLRYMTDGMLLREALLDPTLKNYSVVIIDEAHERTIAIDVLLGILKKALEARPVHFRVIIMSATLDAAAFKTYFPGSTAAYVEGRQYPVDILYTAEPQESYLDSAITAVLQIHLDEGPGDILVFLTGHDDIEAAEQLLSQRASILLMDSQHFGLIIVPLYAALAPEAQLRVFEPAPQGFRKVILATNIAETSVTIPGIRYVVDSGFVKMRTYSARLGADCLEVVPISQAQARQRSGRAGREGPGKVYRLYTEKAFETLQKTTEAEIKRANLASVVLQLKAMGIRDVLAFDFIDSPSRGALLRAFELLFALGALDTKGSLTETIGR